MKTVFDTNYPNFEVIFVDDGSSDDSVELVTKMFGKDSRLKIVCHGKNLGLATARNTGIRLAKGQIIAFLDTDLEVDPNWLLELVKVLNNDKTIGVAMSKVLDMYERKRILWVGQLVIPYVGWTFVNGYGEEDNGQYGKVEDICACLNAAAIKREVFTKVGLIDAKMTYLWEDIDFEWRVWASGFREVLVPTSIVYHLSKPPRSREQTYKWTMYKSDFFSRDVLRFFLKNYEIKNIIKYVPIAHLLLLFRILLAIKRRDLSVPFASFASVLWQLRLLPDTLSERNKVQRFLRKMTDDYIMQKVAIKGSLIEIYRAHKRILSLSSQLKLYSLAERMQDQSCLIP